MNYPNEFTLEELQQYASFGPELLTESGILVPLRPLGYASFISRIKLTWLVFTGRADVVTWPENQ